VDWNEEPYGEIGSPPIKRIKISIDKESSICSHSEISKGSNAFCMNQDGGSPLPMLNIKNHINMGVKDKTMTPQPESLKSGMNFTFTNIGGF
jgi:hypothetical protein